MFIAISETSADIPHNNERGLAACLVADVSCTLV